MPPTIAVLPASDHGSGGQMDPRVEPGDDAQGGRYRMPESIGEFDYVIVGAGSAGCVLANRLSADPDVTVLLLEAGGRDDYIWIHIPVGYLYTMNNPRTDWCFSTEPEAGLNGRALNYPRGKVLGGCSSINGMIYMRGQARDYDQWRQLGNTGWSWDDVLPYFKRSEDNRVLTDEMHGTGGEWRVERGPLTWPILDAFREAAAETGIPKTEDFNRGDNLGCGYFQVNQKKGVRWSTAKGFLKPALSRPNMTVLTEAQALGLVFNGRRAAGLDVRHGGRTRRVTARGEVILASGAIGSPQLLQLSGIGPGGLLQEHGIAVRHELPGVGGNLQDHLQIRTVFKISGARTLNGPANSPIGRALMGVRYALTRGGPLSMAPSQLGAFARSDDARETANLEYHVQPLSTDKLGGKLHPFNAFTASVCNLRPDSRGTVTLKSADPLAAPAIKPNYLSTPSDRQVAAASAPPRRCNASRRTSSAQARKSRATRTSPGRPAISAPRSSTRSAPARWAETTAPWSTSACGCTDSRACAWSTPRSCRPSPRATPTRPPS